MSVARKIALWGLGILLSLMTAVVLFFALAGDAFYLWALRQAVEGAVDREVHVDGSFSLELGWQPTLSVTDIWLENADWAAKKEMVRAQHVEVQLALKPLFSGILHVPSLVVRGVDVELEQTAELQRNWDIGSPDRGIKAEDLEDPVYPLLDTVSMSDITVTYHDRKSDREIVLRLDSLEKLNEGDAAAPAHFIGAGSVNQRPFEVSARLGSIDDAIAAVAPFPLDIEVQSTNFTLTVAGTVDDLPDAKGLNVSLEFRSHSLNEMLQTLQIDGHAFGPAQASTHLRGDLSSLAAEEIYLLIASPRGEQVTVEGRIADLVRGEGVALKFAGQLDPESLVALGDLSPAAHALLNDLTDMSLSGGLAGSYKHLALEDLDLQVSHSGGATAELQGQATAGLSGGSVVLADFAAKLQASLPDESLLVDVLRERIPPMTGLHAEADIAWSGDWIELRSARVTGKALDDVEIAGKGRIGQLSGTDFVFGLDADLGLTGTSSSSRPLFYIFEGFSPSKWRAIETPSGPPQADAELVRQIQQDLVAAGFDPGRPDGKIGPATRAAIEDYQRGRGLAVDGLATEALLQHLQGIIQPRDEPAPLPAAEPSFPMTEALPELGPIDASIRLLFKDQVFRFQKLDLTLGSGESQVKAVGNLGRLDDGPEGVLSDIDMRASFALPSSLRFAELLPPETPEFTQVSGSLTATGTENLLSLSDLKAAASGPSGLRAAVNAGATKLDLKDDLEIPSLNLELEVSWPDSRSLYDFIDQEVMEADLPSADLPELGPVQAQAILKREAGQNAGAAYVLENITVSAGTAEQPKLQMAGGLGDLVALAGLDIAGDFDLETALLLSSVRGASSAEFGRLRGNFRISDIDGSLGLEDLNAEIEEAALLSLSLRGLFEDFEAGSGLRLTADLDVPNLTALGHQLEINAEDLGAFSYQGELSGDLEKLNAVGQAKLGKTRFRVQFSSTHSGARPAIKGRLSSPLVRLADLGMVPDERTLTEMLEEIEKQAEPQESEWVFDEKPIPFGALTAVDLDLDIELESVEGADLDIDLISGRIALIDGKLAIDPLSFDFVGGQAEASLHADSRTERPQVAFALSANNVNLAKLLAQAQVEVPLDGTLDVILDLTGNGDSPRELASSLNGTTQLALTEGHVLTGLLTLTITNPVSWVFSESAREGYSKMNCLILRFDVEDGLAESQTLLLDTPNMLANGTGQIDLRDETLKLDIVPHAKRKRLLPVSIPFSIEGRLADPSISVDSAGASLRTSKEVLLTPLNLLGSLLPFAGAKDEGEGNPCLTLKPVTPTE